MKNLLRYPVALVLLALGIAGLVYVVGSLATQATLPSDGVLLTEFFSPGLNVATRLLGEATVLEPGDEILAIEGRAVDAWGARALRAAPPPAWSPGRSLRYRLRRGDAVLEVPVELIRFPLGRLPLARFGVYVLVFVQLGVGFYLLLSRPDDAATRLFFVIAVCLIFTLLLHTQVMTLVTPWLFVVENGLKFLSRCVLFSAILHLCLIFPLPKLRSASATRRLVWLHGLSPLLSLLAGALLGRSTLHSLALAFQVSAWLGLLMLALAVLSVVHTYITVHEPAVRAQIRWVFWGGVVGLLPYLLLTGVPEALSGQPLLTIEVTAFFVLVAPLAIAIAVARYRLFDIDGLIWRTLFYAIFVFLTIGAYFFFRLVIDQVSRWFAGDVLVTTSVFFATFLTVSGFWLLRAPMLHMVDRLLYRTVRDPQELLKQMTSRLNSIIRLDQLTQLLSQELPQELGAARGALMVLSEDEDCLESVSGTEFCLPLEGLLETWMAHGGEPVLRSAPQPWVLPQALRLMDERAIELVVPLCVGEGQIVGLWGLGRREGNLSYTTADIHLVELLGQQVALAVQNARLVRHMELHRQHLEMEVQRRTEAMAVDRNRLNAILQNMADALLVTDAARHIQLTNPAFERLVRRSARALVGRKLGQVLPLPELSEAIDEALERPGMFRVAEMKLVDPRLSASNDVKLTERILRASVTALGDKSAVICVLQDITHQVEVDRMKSEFVSAVSHELRTPLTSILGFAKLTHRTFERSILPELPEQKAIRRAADRIYRNLDIMVQEGARITALINDVLDIAALDAGTITWRDQPYELSASIQRVVGRLREEAQAKGLELRVHDETRLPLLKGDPERIDQVVTNLVSNAIKFTASGHIAISLELLEPGTVVHRWAAPAPGAALVSVRDTGTGIPPEEMPQIFERFSQGGDMLHNKPSGTGLGLAICKEIVMHYDGVIWVESEVGQGSTFYFTLPLPPSSDRETSYE